MFQPSSWKKKGKENVFPHFSATGNYFPWLEAVKKIFKYVINTYIRINFPHKAGPLFSGAVTEEALKSQTERLV